MDNFGTGADGAMGTEKSSTGLAAIGDTLYMVGADTDALHTVNTTTGVATRVGNADRFGVMENGPTGLAAIGNTLYMVGTLSGGGLYRADPVPPTTP